MTASGRLVLASILVTILSRATAQLASAGGACFVTGFNNESFSFAGLPGNDYLLLSAADLAVNVELISAGIQQPQQHAEGNFIGGVAILREAFSLYAHTDAAGNMTVNINGLQLDVETPAKFNDGQISYAPYMADFGQVVTIQDSAFHLAIVGMKPFTNDAGEQVHAHIDVHAKALSFPGVTAQGILGETLGRPAIDQPVRDALPHTLPSLSYRRDPVVALSAATSAVVATTSSVSEPVEGVAEPQQSATQVMIAEDTQQSATRRLLSA